MTKQLAFAITRSLNYTSYLCSIYHFVCFFHYFDYITTLQLTLWNIKKPPIQPVYHYFSDIYILYLSEKLNGIFSHDGWPLPQVQPGLLIYFSETLEKLNGILSLVGWSLPQVQPSLDQAELEVVVTHQGKKCHLVFLKGIVYRYQKNNGKRAVEGVSLYFRGSIVGWWYSKSSEESTKNDILNINKMCNLNYLWR